MQNPPPSGSRLNPPATPLRLPPSHNREGKQYAYNPAELDVVDASVDIHEPFQDVDCGHFAAT